VGDLGWTAGACWDGTVANSPRDDSRGEPIELAPCAGSSESTARPDERLLLICCMFLSMEARSSPGTSRSTSTVIERIAVRIRSTSGSARLVGTIRCARRSFGVGNALNPPFALEPIEDAHERGRVEVGELG
jgi:hypothetical protein